MLHRSIRRRTFSAVSSTNGLFFLLFSMGEGGACAFVRAKNEEEEKAGLVHALPIDVEHDGYSWSEKGWQHPQPAQESVFVVRPPVHVLSEYGRNGNPYCESHGVKVR